MKSIGMRAGILLCCLATLPGCPELRSSMNMTGNYTGKWLLPGEEGADDEECPMSFDVIHYAGAYDPIEATEVTGYVNLDFTCFELLHTLLELQEIEVGLIPVVGNIFTGGNFLLRSDDLVGCNSDLCISLILSGKAVDKDGDGDADILSGEWSAFFPVQASGTFTVAIKENGEAG
jgi:hypothetical protein